MTTPQVQPLDVIEIEMAVLARSLELLRRHGRIHRDLDRSGYLLLRTLEDGGPLSIHSLAERVGLDGSTVTRQVAALVEDGLAERSPDPADRRACRVSPTQRGRDLMREVQGRRRERMEEALASWSDGDRAELARVLARLNRSIAQHVLETAAASD
ncbi:MAG TPA: MarR family transcriptional regulator [Candidatus Dormibacteraeota bacterium]|nr:MarR family transcriptional regulator [Candidatus Dormibacteraeota bacterium]